MQPLWKEGRGAFRGVCWGVTSMGYARLGPLLGALLLSSACAGQRIASAPAALSSVPSGGPSAPATTRPAAPPSVGHEERGEASWYGNPYHGRRAASGEIYDMNQMTAAHRTLPFDTRVWVESLVDGSGVELRINDRGPFKDPDRRIIDVSYAAARLLGVVGPGVIPVRVRVVALPGTARAAPPLSTPPLPTPPPPPAPSLPAASTPSSLPAPDPAAPPSAAAPAPPLSPESSPPISPPATPVASAADSSTGASLVPREAAASPREAAVVPRQAAAPPREAAVVPRQAVPPREAAVVPREAAAPPREAAVVPREAVAPPREAAAPVPREVAVVPREAAAPPREVAAAPREAAAPVPREAATAPRAGWTVQLGAYSSEGRAVDLARAWPDARVQKADLGGRPVWRVRVGRYPTRREAEEAAQRMAAAGHRVIVVEDAAR
jgi:rare lipoprotein A